MDTQSFTNRLKLEEVTSAAMGAYNSTVPDPKGLVSFEIFGNVNTVERKTKYAFIELNGHFLHPQVYYELSRMIRGFEQFINGNEEYYIEDGKLLKVKQGQVLEKSVHHGSGLAFLYKHWNELNFKPKPSDAAATAVRKKFIHVLEKTEVFMSRCPVIPAFYRDVDMSTGRRKKTNIINVMYTRLILNAQTIKLGSATFEMYGMSSSHRKIQDTLIELYNHFVDMLSGTKGFIHRNIMGKTTDYSARSVISMPRYTGNSVKDEEVDFSHSAVPLSAILKCGAPFIHYGLKQMMQRILSRGNYVFYKNAKGKIERLALAHNIMDMVSQDNLERLIDLYDESKEHRLDPFLLPTEDGRKVPFFFLYTDPNKETVEQMLFANDTNIEDILLTDKISDMNLTELFYKIAYDTVRDKAIYITRYPIEDQHNIYPSLFNIVPCLYTEKIIIDGVLYPRFPKRIPKGMYLKHFFVDSLRVCPIYNKALGADYDGDMVSFQMAFTDEANEEAKKYIYSKTNMLNIGGGTMRMPPDVNLTSIYYLTYKRKNE